LVGAVWQVVAAGDALGVDVRLAAGVNFKNLVKYRWVRFAGSLVQNVLHAGSKLIATNVLLHHTGTYGAGTGVWYSAHPRAREGKP
jgi:hypothetical protein